MCIRDRIYISRARMDCGSCSEEIVDMVEAHCRHFYIRANYRNIQKGLDYSPIYLVRFFRNLLLKDSWVLKNRYLPVSYTHLWSHCLQWAFLITHFPHPCQVIDYRHPHRQFTLLRWRYEQGSGYSPHSRCWYRDGCQRSNDSLQRSQIIHIIIT